MTEPSKSDQIFTAQEKFSEIMREIAMRQRVYPSLIAKGKLTQRQASRQLDILRQVASDYGGQLS